MVTRKSIYFLSILFLPLLFMVQAAHADMDFDIEIDPILRVDVPSSSVNLELSPNQFQSAIATIGLRTNNITGLTATISTASSSTDLSTSGDNPFTIPTLSADTTKGAFQAGFWGYSLDDENYKGMPALGTGTFQIITENPSGNADHSLYLGAKVDEFQPATTYSNSIQVFAVTNYVPMTFNQAFAAAGKTDADKVTATDGKQYYKMQDISSTICNDVATGVSNDGSDTQTTQLVDTRDGKTYWVSKLKDGNCWMTQNLELDLALGQTLSSEDTDLGYTAYKDNGTVKTWTLSTGNNDRATQTTNGIAWQYDGKDGIRSYKYGEKYYAPQVNNPNLANLEANSFTYNSMEACKAGGAVVGDFTDTAHTEEECRHYKAGNLYNWTAATAKSGMGISSGNASDSICPSGWQLPIYGGWSKLTSFYLTTDMNTTQLKTFAVQQAPLYLVRSGYYYYSNGNLYDQANYMYYWSATASSATNAYSLLASPTYFNTQGSSYRGYGRSVRCVAR